MFSQLNNRFYHNYKKYYSYHDVWPHPRLVRGTSGSGCRGPRVEDPKGLGGEIDGDFGGCNGDLTGRAGDVGWNGEALIGEEREVFVERGRGGRQGRRAGSTRSERYPKSPASMALESNHPGAVHSPTICASPGNPTRPTPKPLGVNNRHHRFISASQSVTHQPHNPLPACDRVTGGRADPSFRSFAHPAISAA